jgi:hypothetical protein
MGRRPPVLSTLEAEFEAHLKLQGKSANTIKYRRSYIRRFLKHVGDLPLQRVSEEQVSEFFTQEFANKKSGKVTAAVAISAFIRFALAKLPAPVVGRGSEMAPARAQTKKELALRQQWSLDKLVEQKETTDDLIAQLARKLIDHYLYFQGRIKGEPENLDDVVRFADECRDLIERNLPLFMGLSAGGRNIHSKIDERVQR